jgi:hypothetical protein
MPRPRPLTPSTDDAPRDLGWPARLLVTSLVLSVSWGLFLVGLGVNAIVDDQRQHGEELDGLGVFLGTIVVVGGLLWAIPHLVLALLAWRAVRRHQRSGRQRPLTVIGAASAVLGAVLLFLLVVAKPLGPVDGSTVLVPCALSAAVLTGGLVVMTSRR